MASAILSRLGIAVVDTDEIAREMVAPGQPALAEIREAFGDGVFRPDGTLDRQRVAEVIFRNTDARAKLEGILHPRIRQAWAQRVGGWRSQGVGCGVVVIPLLFETAAENHFDAVVCVACSETSQRQRLRERGWSDEHSARRISAQLPVATKMLKSQYVVWTEPPVPVHEAQLKVILATLGVSVKAQEPAGTA